MKPSLRCAAIAGLLVGATLPGVASAEESPRRDRPDYAGRPPPGSTPGEVALWIPRVVFFPVYVTTECLIRVPLGAAISAAERANVPEALYDFFAFGPEHKSGFAPIAFVDFGLNPSVGIYAFWDDAFFKGDNLRLHVSAWPDEVARGVRGSAHQVPARWIADAEVRGHPSAGLPVLRHRTGHPPIGPEPLRAGQARRDGGHRVRASGAREQDRDRRRRCARALLTR